VISLLAGHLRNRGSIPGRKKKFISSKASRSALFPTLASSPMSFPGAKRRRRVAVLRQNNAGVKNDWRYTSTVL
jgi:hypothetical protein